MDIKHLVLEYLRPWKLVTLAVGVMMLIIGSYYYKAPDWDIPISLIMAGFTYITAPLSMRILLERKWHHLPLALIATWFSVDGCYAIYWHFKNPVVLELMREANFYASLSLYGLCGILWLHPGGIAQLYNECLKALRSTD